ncbi:MAG: acyl-CoA thioesterase [Polyangiales bacterium]
MTELVLPSHTNALGTIFGGTIMGWVDLCAAIAAQRHCNRTVVTAFVDDFSFQGPVRTGEVVRLEARVNATFRTSMEVEVIVMGENPIEGRSWPCVQALLMFVAIDETTRKPVPVPPLVLDTEEAQERQREAEKRREHRLAKSAR